MKNEKKDPLTLPEDAQWRLQRCHGFLDLKMLDKARRELEMIDASHRLRDPFIETELRLAMAENRCRMRAIRAHTQRAAAGRSAFCVQLAYASGARRTLKPRAKFCSMSKSVFRTSP